MRRVGNWTYQPAHPELGDGIAGWRLNGTTIVVDRTTGPDGPHYELATACPGVGAAGTPIDRYRDATFRYIEHALDTEAIHALTGR